MHQCDSSMVGPVERGDQDWGEQGTGSDPDPEGRGFSRLSSEGRGAFSLGESEVRGRSAFTARGPPCGAVRDPRTPVAVLLLLCAPPLSLSFLLPRSLL